MLKNTNDSYGSVTKLFHWIMAILIIGIITAGFIMTDMEPSELKWYIYGQHKAFGVLILSLIPLRIIWRFLNKRPALPRTVPAWQKLAANANIALLYILMVVMPTTGFAMSYYGGYPIDIFGFFTIGNPDLKITEISKTAYQIHMTMAWVIAGSVGLHIAAGLFHHFVRKDNVFKRMLPGKY